MKDDDIEIGQHCWALCAGELLVVLKTGHGEYQVCGAWEGGVYIDELELLEIIERPEQHQKTKLYYDND